MNWEEAVSVGVILRENKDTSQWQLGDLAKEIETEYGSNSIGKFAIDIGVNKKSLYQYRRVSQAYPQADRIPFLSHRHHLILASRPDRKDWLNKSADNSWSTLQLQRELAIAGGKSSQFADQGLTKTCTVCGGLKIISGGCTCGQT